MSEQAEYAMTSEKTERTPGPIAMLQVDMDAGIGLLEKLFAQLRDRLNPIVREDEDIRAVPSQGREERGVSPFARSYQEQVRQVDVLCARVRELTESITL